MRGNLSSNDVIVTMLISGRVLHAISNTGSIIAHTEVIYKLFAIWYRGIVPPLASERTHMITIGSTQTCRGHKETVGDVPGEGFTVEIKHFLRCIVFGWWK